MLTIRVIILGVVEPLTNDKIKETLYNMPLEKTYEELLASKINPRNPSAVLPVIYNLRKKSFEKYKSVAVERIAFSNGIVGAAGTTAVFNAIATPTCARGGIITLAGTATYKLTSGAVSYIKPAINIIAQIDNGAKQVWALATQIGDNGAFIFTIPGSITAKLTVGPHYVYIDAASPDNRPVRLVASDTSSEPTNPLWFTRTFTITE